MCVCVLTCVYVGVFLHVGLLVEALATVLAGVGPGVCVDEQVGGEGGGALECLATLFAAKRPFLSHILHRLTTNDSK